MPWIGSTTNAATSPRASSRSSASRSPKPTGSQPGSSGPKPSRNSASPLSDSEPSVSPWKACSAYSTRGRPVAARATLIAASTASVPVFAGTIAATLPGARASSCSASTPLSSVTPSCGRLPVRAAITCSTAAIASGWLRPIANTP